MPKTNECNLFLSPVLEEDIISTVNACKSKTSCDHNNIDMVIVKQVINYITKPLANVCSKSFECGVFPDNMKVAKVVPLFKAGDRSLFSNYRPISLLSQFSKILEKLFNERLDKFIDKFQLLNNCQYGFRSQMSTSHALLDLVEEITSSIDAKKISIGVFIDLKKAFDTVNHDLLIDKLEYYGIRGIAQEWLKSYLKDRKQFVQIDECASTLLSVTCGVPQGSILGPKLIILYIKAGDRSLFSNYRPISLLSQFSKILEKLFNERLDKFIDKFQLLNNCQYGFRSQMSTSHALLDLVEEITSSIDAKKISIGVFIDLKKAFDTVNHDLLIDKLEYYGIRGIAQEWLKSYLKDRKQFVQIDECASTLLSVTCGVPQGSILGPKLFIMYINDICNASSILKFILFADDTNVFFSGVDIQTLCECISRELNKLHVWLSVNKLSLNVDKTNYILFGNRIYIDNVCIAMNNSIITRVRATKVLGVIIDEKLTWKDHISLVRSKFAKTVGILYRVRHLLNLSALFILYCSLFLPYLTYCAEIWGNTFKSNIQCIFILQKKIV